MSIPTVLGQNIAIVKETPKLSIGQTTNIVNALYKQVSRDLAISWGAAANVTLSVIRARKVGRVNDRKIVLVDKLPWVNPQTTTPPSNAPATVGFLKTLDDNQQPIFYVTHKQGWTVHLSRLVIDMIINPFGNQFITAPLLTNTATNVLYAADVCSPVQGEYYTINNVPVSNFATMTFFNGANNSNDPSYDQIDKVTAPLQIQEKGYLAWLDPITYHMKWQGLNEGVVVTGDIGAMGTNVNHPSAWLDSAQNLPVATFPNFSL